MSKNHSVAAAFGGKRTNVTWDTDAYGTPWDVYNFLNFIFKFSIDVCASADNAKHKRFWTIDDDALTQSWKGERAFCNPPFSQTEKWLAKAYAETRKRGTCAVVLCKFDTSTKWFHNWYREAELLEFFGRIQFVPPPGMPLTKLDKNGKEVPAIGSPNCGHGVFGFGDFEYCKDRLLLKPTQYGFTRNTNVRF